MKFRGHLKNALLAAVAVAASVLNPGTRSLDDAIREASARAAKAPPAGVFSMWRTTISHSDRPDDVGPWRHNLSTTTAVGYPNINDWLASAMGNGPAQAFATAKGFATSVTSTSLTTGTGFPTSGNGLSGQIVFFGPNNAGVGGSGYGIITSNSATALTVDQWYDPTSSTGAAGSAPNGTCSYVVAPGQNPAAWLSVSISSFTPATSDQSLNTQGAELAANGFSRAVATWAHSHGGSTYTLVHLWTATGTDTINNEGVSGAATILGTPNFGGVFPFESGEPSPPTLVSGDTLQNTITVTI